MKQPNLQDHSLKHRRRQVFKTTGKSLTEQSHKKACDINTIMAKYQKTGLIDHVKKHSGTYGDVTGADFQDAQNLVAEQKTIFAELPASVRAEFDNDPANYLELVMTDEGVQELENILNPAPEPEIEEETPESVSETPTESEGES